MNSIDFLTLEILGTLLPLGAVVASAILLFGVLKEVYLVHLLAAARKVERPVFEGSGALRALDGAADVMRSARGRVSTAMRSTRHAPDTEAEQYAVA